MGKILLASLVLVLVCSALVAILLGTASGLINVLSHRIITDQIYKARF